MSKQAFNKLAGYFQKTITNPTTKAQNPLFAQYCTDGEKYFEQENKASESERKQYEGMIDDYLQY